MPSESALSLLPLLTKCEDNKTRAKLLPFWRENYRHFEVVVEGAIAVLIKVVRKCREEKC